MQIDPDVEQNYRTLATERGMSLVELAANLRQQAEHQNLDGKAHEDLAAWADSQDSGPKGRRSKPADTAEQSTAE